MTENSKVRLLLLAFLFIFSENSKAIGFEDGAFPELVTDASALALGNAYMSKVDNAWAAFYNPAGLGSVRKNKFQFAAGSFEGNREMFNTAGDNGAGSLFPRMVAQQLPEGIFEQIQGKIDKIHHSRLNLFPNIVFRNLTLGWMFSQRSRAVIPSISDPVEIAFRRDFGPVLGLNFSMWGGIFKLGISSALLSRKEYQSTHAQSPTPITIAETDYDTGRMVHSTIGMRLTLPFMARMALSAVIRNAFEAEFTDSYGDGTNLPTNIPRTYDYGISFTPMVGKTTRFHFEFTIKDTSNAYNTTDYRRKRGFGMEIDLSRSIFIRFGDGDGFGSFGVGFDSGGLEFDITTYAVDVSDGLYRGSEERRFAMAMKMGF